MLSAHTLRQRIHDKQLFAKRALFLLGLFGLFLILGYLFPFTHDDWAWGSVEGLKRLHSYFSNYNGRWMGNLTVMLLTRQRLLRALLYALTFTLTMLLAQRITGKNRFSMLVTLLLLLTIPVTMFAQAIAWTAGFANYTISVPFILCIVNLSVRRLFVPLSDTLPAEKPLPILAAMLIAFLSTLFIEHNTIYILSLCVFANIFFFVKRKKVNWMLLCVLFASLAGAALMFSNGAYRSAVTSDNQYQQAALGGGMLSMLQTAANSYFQIIVPLLSRHILLNVFLCAGAITLLYLHKVRLRLLVSAFLTVFLVYEAVYRWLSSNADYFSFSSVLFGILYLVFVAALAYALWHCAALRWKGLFFLGSAAALTVPLLLVSPVGERNFYVIYLFLFFICAILLPHLSAQIAPKSRKRVLRGILALSCTAFSIFYMFIFAKVYSVDRYRTRLALELVQQGQTQITLPRLPYEQYMHASSPSSKGFQTRFKLFYGLPQSTDLHFEPYAQFQEESENNLRK